MDMVNYGALMAVAAFFLLLVGVFGAVYVGGRRSYVRKEMGPEGLRLLRLALVGHAIIFALLAATALFT